MHSPFVNNLFIFWLTLELRDSWNRPTIDSMAFHVTNALKKAFCKLYSSQCTMALLCQ